MYLVQALNYGFFDFEDDVLDPSFEFSCTSDSRTNVQWDVKTDQYFNGIHALKSGYFKDPKISSASICREVDGPARIRFQWKKDSSLGDLYSELRFSDDKNPNYRKFYYSSESLGKWQGVDYGIRDSEKHMLIWEYKLLNQSYASKSAAAWIDDINISKLIDLSRPTPSVQIKMFLPDYMCSGTSVCLSFIINSSEKISKVRSLRIEKPEDFKEIMHKGTGFLDGVRLSNGSYEFDSKSASESGVLRLRYNISPKMTFGGYSFKLNELVLETINGSLIKATPEQKNITITDKIFSENIDSYSYNYKNTPCFLENDKSLCDCRARTL